MNFFYLHKAYQDRVNAKLSDILKHLPFQKSDLLKAMKYSIFSGSKRLRSCLVYATGEAFKVHHTTLDVISAAIECIHSYSLIHDDLPCIDNDNMRRGKISCHLKYGVDVALLAGDSLHSLAFNILSKNFMPEVSSLKRINIILELSDAIGSSGMCMGQLLDLESKNKKVSISDLETTNLYKTAFLMRASVRLAYLSSNKFSYSILSNLDCFSTSIGLAFQIQDDILDLKNDTCKYIKNKKNDQKIKKNTYPLIIGLNESNKKLKKLYEKALFALDDLKNYIDINTLKKLAQFIIKSIQ